MTSRRAGLWTILLAFGVLGILAACTRQAPAPKATPAESAAPSPAPTPKAWTPEPKTQPEQQLQVQTSADYFNKQHVLKRIHFDTDKWNIRPEDRAILKENAQWLLAHPQFKVIIEGHCDERQTQAYNLALGERRADAAKQYLIGLGIPATRIQTVSYGKSRPLCTEHTEECWAKNRRDEFLLEDMNQ
ncbi:MAG: peptidoglycan-associated lipoprotein Pal [Acidobacteriota bacterium]|jgi:peptidoglycan-associated lipoprotein